MPYAMIPRSVVPVHVGVFAMMFSFVVAIPILSVGGEQIQELLGMCLGSHPIDMILDFVVCLNPILNHCPRMIPCTQAKIGPCRYHHLASPKLCCVYHT